MRGPNIITVLLDANLKVGIVLHPIQMSITSDIKKLPEIGEIIIATVKDVTGHGAYVTLDEYNNITGFLAMREIATGWVRNVQRYVKPKQKIVLKVIRVDKARAEVDTSLKQVSGEERKSKLIEIKRSEKASAFMEAVKLKASLTDSQVREIEEKILSKYDYIYDVFEAVAKKGNTVLQKLEVTPEIAKAIEEESNKIQVPYVEVRGIMEISSKTPDGIEMIKNTLLQQESSKAGVNIGFTYIGAPKYRIVIKAENFKLAEKTINNLIEKIRSLIEKQHGVFNFTREESKKTHQP